MLALCACSQTGQSQPAQEETAGNSAAEEQLETVSLTDVRTAVLDGVGIADPLFLESEMLADLYGITEDLLTQSAGFVTMSGTFPDEVIFTEAVDEAAALAIEEALLRRLDEVLVQSKTYDAENYALAQECSVVRIGLYVGLILSPLHAEISDIYESFFF